MDIPLAQYRITIGLFNRCKIVKCGVCCVVSSQLMINLMFLLIMVVVLIILCGDIQLNPGPVKCKQLKVCHVNIRSLSRAKYLAIKLSLAKVYDIITVSETHLHTGITNDLFKLEGFHEMLRKDRDDGYGGVAVFIKDNINFKRLVKYERKDVEALWIQVNSIKGKILICCCYRPPNDQDFWNNFDEVLNDIKGDIKGSLFVLGDINADFNTSNGHKLTQLCSSQNLDHLINEPTRITSHSATTLDQILTNAPNYVVRTEVNAPVSCNDHCTVCLYLNFKIEREKSYQRVMWNFNEADFNKFRHALSVYNFDKGFNENDVDASCENWTKSFLDIAKATISNRVVTVRPNDSPWFDSKLRSLKRRMIHAFHIHKKSLTVTHWDNYKKLSSEYHSGLDDTEKSYKTSLCDSLAKNKNTRKWWSTVKWLLGKGNDTSYSPLIVENNQITDNKAKANEFNKFFLSHANIDDSQASLPVEQEFPHGLGFVSATEEEVFDYLKCIDPTKATGPDEISPKLLKEAGITIVPSLTRLINLSLKLCKVPTKWKIANVLPLFKKGRKTDPNNYRPVSLLSCVSKILERVVFKKLFNYLRTINFISEHQSGFQPGDSTVNQLTYLYHSFAEALDQKKDVHIIFCDISKAFDRVWHKGLLYKLRKAGVFGNLLNWFIDYLADRYQCVAVRGQKSEFGLIKAGVPQGSVLGPLLFLIYINDITSITQCKIKLFADDTSLYIEFDDAVSATNVMNNDLRNIQLWADQWLVNFSPPKTKLMTCSNKRVEYPDV